MKNSIEKVFVVGGTGFLGYYSCLEFLKRGVMVSTISRGSVELGDWFPKQIDVVNDLDIFKASQEELAKAFEGHSVMIYSVGPDDRVVPETPAYDFFHEKLVVQCSKVVKAAKDAGVKRVVIMNSYFAYFDRKFDGLLSKNHPYIRARVEQAEACIDIGEKGSMDVMILELPYIFGCMPERKPIWRDVFLSKFENMKTVYLPKGGTVMVHVKDVAKTVVASAFKGEHGVRYPIGSYNMKFTEMVKIMYKYLGVEKKVLPVPSWICYLGGLAMKRKLAKEGKEAGLDSAKLMTQVMSKDFYYLPEDIVHSDKFDVKEGIESAMKACYPEKFPDFDPIQQVEEDLEIIKKVWGKN